jgi:hypothetical protein
MFTHASKLPTNPVTNIVLLPSALCQKEYSLYMDLKINVRVWTTEALPLKKRVKGLDSVRLHVMLRFPGIKV